MRFTAWRAIAVWLLVLAAALWVLRGTSFRGDISAFLPSKPSDAQKILVEQLQDGVVSRILLLAIEGGNESERADASRAFIEQLASLPSLAYVHNGDETRMGRCMRAASENAATCGCSERIAASICGATTRNVLSSAGAAARIACSIE